jgi:transcriptional regulator NrdR family protein
MIKVIKKGGEREEFNLNKIKKSLIAAIEKTDLNQEKKNELVEKITKEVLKFAKEKKEVFTAEIEAKILLELDESYPQAAKLWREYRAQKQRAMSNKNNEQRAIDNEPKIKD